MPRLLLIAALLATSATAQAVPAPKLPLVGTDKAVKGFGTSELTFNFGTVDMTKIDDIEEKFETDREKGLFRYGAVESSFVFKNTSKRTLQVVNYWSEKGGVSASFSRSGRYVGAAKIAPGEQWRLHVSIDYNTATPGPFKDKLFVVGEGGKDLAIVNVVGTIKGEISASTGKLDFGKIDSATGAAQTFDIHLWRYLPSSLPSGESVKVVSSNPRVIIDGIAVVGKNPGLTLEKDSFKLKDVELRDFGRDLVLRVTVRVPAGTIPGAVKSNIILQIPGFPLWTNVTAVRVEVQGTVGDGQG
ncbi:DUF1573 domain-containing protein [bacterium]|nr:MAG: DUF1573 domain-containing protein [bacterium]